MAPEPTALKDMLGVLASGMVETMAPRLTVRAWVGMDMV